MIGVVLMMVACMCVVVVSLGILWYLLFTYVLVRYRFVRVLFGIRRRLHERRSGVDVG